MSGAAGEQITRALPKCWRCQGRARAPARGRVRGWSRMVFALRSASHALPRGRKPVASAPEPR